MVADRLVLLYILRLFLSSYNNHYNNHKETGGIMITPRPSTDDSTPKAGFPTRPFWGIEPVLVDEKVG